MAAARQGTGGETAHIGLPGAAENIGYRQAFMVSVSVGGMLGMRALATHAHAMRIIQLVLLYGLAKGLSVEIVVGHLIGTGRLRQAHQLVDVHWRAGCCAGCRTRGSAGGGWRWAVSGCVDG